MSGPVDCCESGSTLRFLIPLFSLTDAPVRFTGRGLSLIHIFKSRPMPNVPWEYYFYVEVVGDLSAEKSKELLDTMSGVCRTVRVLGVSDRQAAR